MREKLIIKIEIYLTFWLSLISMIEMCWSKNHRIEWFGTALFLVLANICGSLNLDKLKENEKETK